MIIESPRPAIQVPAAHLTEFVLGRARERGERPALVDGPSGRTLSYAALAEAVERCAAGLVARGLEPGQTVGIFAPNLPEYVVAYHGVALAGGASTTVNGLFTVEELVLQLRDARARFLFAAPALLATALRASRAAELEEIFILGEGDGATPLSTLLDTAEPAPQIAIDPAEHVVALPYSSGTTGVSKGVMLTHRNLVANLAQVEGPWALGDEGECTIGVLPFFHIFGQTALVNHALRVGATLVTMPRFELEAYLELSERHGATFGFIVPPLALALARHPAVAGHDLSALRWLLSGAAPLDAELERALAERLGCTVMQGYGMTEASPATHSWGVGDIILRGTVGPPLAATEVRLVDPASGEDVGPGAPGEVWVRGPQVMKGYLGRPEATAATVDPEGWLRTGDLAVASESGAIRIVDRLKELIKYKGYPVAPAELEGLLLTHPDVADACVIPVPDEEAGEIPKAFVVLVPEAATTPDEVIDFVAARVAPHKRVRACELIDAIPKSASGKILRRVLIERDRAARV
jgi:acyl-CoA synthetase (AMP-forming)/AMP-acid ligase II